MDQKTLSLTFCVQDMASSVWRAVFARCARVSVDLMKHLCTVSHANASTHMKHT